MNQDKLNKLTLAIRKSQPARSTLDIHSFILNHQIIAESQFNGFVKLFEDCFDDLNIAINYLNYAPKEKWPKHRSIQYLYFPETMKTLHRAFEDAIDGYYDESIMLLRSVFEAWLRMVFVSCFPKDWEAICADIKGQRQFNVTNFMREDLKIDWQFIYSIMCKTSHSKAHYHSSQLISWSKGTKQLPIQLLYRGNKTMLGMCVNLITLDLALLFHTMIMLFQPDFASYPELSSRRSHFVKVDRVLLSVIQHNPRKKFSRISQDILKVEKIVRFADAGKNWRAIS